MSSMLHTLHDGSRLRILGAKDLIKLPVWHGNRIIDTTHVKKIKEGIGHNVQKLDFGYRIVTFTENDAGGNPVEVSYIIDGQHRHRVLCNHYQENLGESDFAVVVLEKFVNSEHEIISHFKELNTQKPIDWKSDPVMLANLYVNELCLAFNSKQILIRPSTTKRPYLSADAIRSEFKVYADRLKDSPEEVKAFVQRVKEYNDKELARAPAATILSPKNMVEIIQKAASHKFMLAVNPRLPWIKECLG